MMNHIRVPLRQGNNAGGPEGGLSGINFTAAYVLPGNKLTQTIWIIDIMKRNDYTFPIWEKKTLPKR
jgi:hypothetical protein